MALEVTLITVFITVASLVLGGEAVDIGWVGARSRIETSNEPSDLPCPWCSFQTVEEDRWCTNCGKHFG